MTKVILKDIIKTIGKKSWVPFEIAKVNNQVVRMAYFKGEYHWHKHDKEDELFFVYGGSITIQIENHPDLKLNKGEIAVIPKNIKHCPKSDRGAYVLMFEPVILNSNGR